MSKTCIAVDTTCIFHRILLDDDVKDGGEGEWACIAVKVKRFMITLLQQLFSFS